MTAKSRRTGVYKRVLRLSLVRTQLPFVIGCLVFVGTACLFSCRNSCRSPVLGPCIPSFLAVISSLHLSTSGLVQDEPCHRQTRATAEAPVENRSRQSSRESRLVSGNLSDLLVVLGLVLVPFEKDLLVVFRASRSADSTFPGLSSLSIIAQTRERNWLDSESRDQSYQLPVPVRRRKKEEGEMNRCSWLFTSALGRALSSPPRCSSHR